jgi:hypothetical protein
MSELHRKLIYTAVYIENNLKIVPFHTHMQYFQCFCQFFSESWKFIL